jgi:hypothetical protein
VVVALDQGNIAQQKPHADVIHGAPGQHLLGCKPSAHSRLAMKFWISRLSGVASGTIRTVIPIAESN